MYLSSYDDNGMKIILMKDPDWKLKKKEYKNRQKRRKYNKTSDKFSMNISKQKLDIV